MQVSDKRKHLYWNHFISEAYLAPHGFPVGTTGPRLSKIKAHLWDNERFWRDVVHRHSGNTVTPEQMAESEPVRYQHCQGNFWGIIAKILRD